jgi:Polyketide cyclase / dehydrase and lipid transport
MPKIEAANEAFLASAPIVLQDTMTIDRPAAEVWSAFTAPDAMHWVRIVKGWQWTSPQTAQVGAERRVKVLGGLLSLDERFFIWDEGARFAFYGTRSNLPMFKHFAEDYVFEPLGEGRMRFTWKIAAEASPAGKPGVPLNKLLLKSLFSDTRKYFGAS